MPVVILAGVDGGKLNHARIMASLVPRHRECMAHAHASPGRVLAPAHLFMFMARNGKKDSIIIIIIRSMGAVRSILCGIIGISGSDDQE